MPYHHFLIFLSSPWFLSVDIKEMDNQVECAPTSRQGGSGLVIRPSGRCPFGFSLFFFFFSRRSHAGMLTGFPEIFSGRDSARQVLAGSPSAFFSFLVGAMRSGLGFLGD